MAVKMLNRTGGWIVGLLSAAGLAASTHAQTTGPLAPRNLEFGPETLTGWVHVGYDFDNDGRFDKTEYVYIADLERAREASAARMARHTQALATPIAPGFAPPAFGQSPRLFGTPEPGSGAAIENIQGRIVGLRAIRAPQTGTTHIFARLRTPAGQLTRVDLGPAKPLEPLNLWIGDRVTIAGHAAMAGRQPIVLADQITAAGQNVRVERPTPAWLRGASGRIQSTQPATIDGKEHTLAVVDLDTGDTTLVDLGPAVDLAPVSLDRGAPIAFLERDCRINGQQAMEAHELDAGGVVVLVDQGSATPDPDVD